MKEYVDPQERKKENSDLFKYKLNYNFEKVKQLIIILKELMKDSVWIFKYYN